MQRWALLHFKGAALPLTLQLPKWSGAPALAPIFKKEWHSRSRSSSYRSFNVLHIYKKNQVLLFCFRPTGNIIKFEEYLTYKIIFFCIAFKTDSQNK